MNYTVNNDFIAVADEIFLQPMSTCPINVEVQLETPGGILVRGKWDGKSKHWKSWFPFPRKVKLEVEPEPVIEPVIEHKEYL